MEIQARKWASKGKKTDLFKIMEKKDKPRLASGVWDAALKKKDPMATKLVERAIWALGIGIASAQNLLDVEAIIIGGGLGIRLGQPFADSIAEAMKPHLIKPNEPPAVLVAELGDLGGALGAALLADRSSEVPLQREDAPAAATKAPAKRAAKAPAKSTRTRSTSTRSTAKRTSTRRATG